MSIQNKKWASFEEMYEDLKGDEHFKSSLKTSQISSVSDVIKEIELAKTSKNFFDCTCKLSSIFESMDQKTTDEVYAKTNVYVLVLNASLRNNNFIDSLYDVLSKNKKISDLKKDTSEFQQLILINSVLSLAFLGIALNHKSINKTSIEFLRKNLTDLLRNILIQKHNQYGNFVDLCFFLEKISWDIRLHYNANFDSKFPIKLNDKFLFENLKTSRAFAGVSLASLVIRPAIENKFKNVISKFNNEDFSISFALDDIFQISNELDEKINHYYRNTPKNVSDFFDIFIRNNERNLIFCFKNFCSGFKYQANKKFADIILNKLNTLPILKKEFVDYTRKNFKAFNKEIVEGDNQWTNKIFLTSLKTISILDEVKNAHDSGWVLNVAIYEFREWISDIHAVLNKYYIEDDWEKIKDLVVLESEKIEWKSSFYTPMEQEYRDDATESGISKRIFSTLTKAILAMLNTDGGNLVVGVVENPDNIKRLELKNYLLKKNGLTFFDVSYELKAQGKTLDNVRLQILENLRRITDRSTEQFNGLIEFEPIMLRNDERVVTVIIISIKKATKLFLNVKKEGDSIWVSLTKRAQGQNVDVDIRNHGISI